MMGSYVGFLLGLLQRSGMEEGRWVSLLTIWLRLLGHMGCMDETRLPKQVRFRDLRKKRPCYGTERRWRDVARTNFQATGIDERWYELCQDRKKVQALL